ncbi:terminase TerL endonuclease subunit [Furfurilactobacillus siliginis]|uniref:Terminase n=1 Tax=Furfurilactobacillus siliginis TaxID=348151 RepID=A0A0R2LC79_9LACO|nr:terminase TerL endonuclease subunit [Furfurilactobacillus siliginis]KRN96844.1 bacteriophage terminase large subunit [Furfurilactobacillus siliginis]GEK28511.1 terminase [Furfurilactobacillus siliginis]
MQEFNFTGIEDIKTFIEPYKEEYKPLLDDYKDIATQYAFRVLFTDDFATSRDVKLASVRHLQDLKRQGEEDFPYTYDSKWVAAIEWFARSIPDPTDTSKLIEPMEWQSFILDSLIGWRNNAEGSRFHIAIVSVARGQGKTWLASILVNFFYFMIGWNATAQDFLIASYDSDHAKKLFEYVSLQAKSIIQMPDFEQEARERDVAAQTYQVIGRNNKNIIRVGSSQAGGFDSRHNLIAVYDEIGAMDPKYNESINQIVSGQQKLVNRLFLEISTAYPNVKAKFKADQDSTRKLVEDDANRDGDDTFMIIYSQDNENEVFEPDTWEKSNPLLALPEQSETLLEALIGLRDKQEREGSLASFANKSMNIWSRRFQNSFLGLDVIQKGIVESFMTRKRDVYIGFDASQVNDNTAFGFEFPYTDHQKQCFYAMQYSFIPFAQAKTLDAKIKQDGLDYEVLASQGFCEVTRRPSGTIDEQQVWEWLVDFIRINQLRVRAIVIDPNLADWLTKKVEHYQPAWPLFRLAPTSYNLSNPTKDFQNRFINGEVKIKNDPLLIDGLNNAFLKEDKGGAIKIDRQNRTSDHIDSTDALINAHSQAQYYFEDYHDEGYNPLNDMDKSERRDFFKSMFGG